MVNYILTIIIFSTILNVFKGPVVGDRSGAVLNYDVVGSHVDDSGVIYASIEVDVPPKEAGMPGDKVVMDLPKESIVYADLEKVISDLESRKKPGSSSPIKYRGPLNVDAELIPASPRRYQEGEEEISEDYKSIMARVRKENIRGPEFEYEPSLETGMGSYGSNPPPLPSPRLSPRGMKRERSPEILPPEEARLGRRAPTALQFKEMYFDAQLNNQITMYLTDYCVDRSQPALLKVKAFCYGLNVKSYQSYKAVCYKCYIIYWINEIFRNGGVYPREDSLIPYIMNTDENRMEQQCAFLARGKYRWMNVIECRVYGYLAAYEIIGKPVKKTFPSQDQVLKKEWEKIKKELKKFPPPAKGLTNTGESPTFPVSPP